MNRQLIFFDGQCIFCNYWVNFIFKRDKQAYFKFAHLQHQHAETFLSSLSNAWQHKDSIVLVIDDQIFTESDAVLEICKRLQGIWPLLYIFRFVPKVVRDYIYRFIAKHRYQWFGKQDTCVLPSDALKARFVEEFNH